MIVNSRSNKTLAKEWTQCTRALSKARGLMFRKPQALLMEFSSERRRGLHMAFVFFPIDVVFMDKNHSVVETKEDFRPFTSYRPKKRAQYILELPAGTVARTQTQVGDHLKIYKGGFAPSDSPGA
ncbi:MAG: DUF192 domain-containing protein [Nanobdellota archaeon]